MTMKNFSLETDADGIATITWDMPGRSMNVIDMSVMNELETIVGKLASDAAIKGAVITSAKDAFCAGADLTMLEALLKQYHQSVGKDETAANQALFDQSRRLSQIFRALETCGKPVVAAINGTALGGGLEICLACHHRVAADSETVKLGLPEVKVGLLPGAGGTQRVARMMQPADALQFLLKGSDLRVSQAKAMGLVDEVVPAKKLVEAAKQWIRDGGKPVAPWDVDGFRHPAKVFSPAGMMTFMPANALYRKETWDNYPGARGILSCVYEGALVPFDTALTIEQRYFASVLKSPQAAAMIRSLFVSMQALGKGARRPADVKPNRIRKVGVIGAGFMGAGIAYVTARAGIDVVLIDQTQEAADRGKAHSEKLLTDGLRKGRIRQADKDATLARITATTDYNQLAGCQLVVEAVFEDRNVKVDVIAKVEAVLGRSAIFASNTSTLPITSLAKASARPKSFIGIHFFSPVDRMMLVEIILGKRTGEKALAMALDYVRAIRKTPIVVNDVRGFYANRCVGNYLLEAHLMVMEGIPPAMIENGARMAGMPVGPLALTDEVAVDLAWKILQATKKDLGEKAVDPRQEKLLEEMVVRRGRLGRKADKGFYEYPDIGRKYLWPDLAQIAPEQKSADEVSIDEVKNRLLATMALEAARCIEEKVVTDVREADVGSILGFGFAPWSGGTLSYIDMMGAAAFVEMCKGLARKHGKRFRPNRLLGEMARNAETFYGRFPPGGGAAAQSA
ncbi:MAG: enoyl-CoA hydratase/isomerase family protein [Rhodobiaceae bacterium]|nr:enoyl-CoA hydratase/isomerase family protein [Rhodobiaceae bacterium]MCC0015746.1 enoyl-CoA hydratase/isomerase family protein [Rhodobiaceae bacterium]MCC0054005.1 enoyl-CoA hydratase/isomerase family protein [Rhodobiaceae bacterium]